MSAPVLSVSEQKEAISGKKKEKKTMKNVLSIPSNLKVDLQFVDSVEAEKLNNILNRLLPSARLPDQQNAKSSRDSIKERVCDTNQVAEIKNRRNQLALGVNAVSRSIKKELISAVLLATDIQPKFLVHHLNLLCSHNQIPFLHISELRNLTKNNLGFPCIAVGFKKNYCDFSEVIEEIKLISKTKKTITGDRTVEISVLNSSSEESEEEIKHNENSEQHDETPLFTYLLRKSTKERIFVPEKCNVDKKSNIDFITVDKDNSEIKFNNKSEMGTSDKFSKKSKRILLLKSIKNDDVDDDVDLQVPKKKKKKHWVIDKIGTPQNYFPANLRRVPSNPGRNRKK